MARAYKATTPIKHGKGDGSIVDFGVGDVVEGLSKEEMAALWDAGALEATEVAAAVSGDASTGSTEGGDTKDDSGNV